MFASCTTSITNCFTFDPIDDKNDQNVHIAHDKTHRNIKIAEITAFVVMAVLAALLAAQLTTNFAGPAQLPGAMSVNAVNTLATKLFITGMGVAFLTGVLAEILRQRSNDADKRLPPEPPAPPADGHSSRAHVEEQESVVDGGTSGLDKPSPGAGKQPPLVKEDK